MAPRKEVALNHGQYMCKCGRKLAGCHCPAHQNLINKVFDNCAFCRPGGDNEIRRHADTRPLKDKMGIEEK